MALFACPECKKEISDKAFVCPQCGLPLRLEQRIARRAKVRRVGGVVALAALAVGGAALYAGAQRADYALVEQLRAEQDAQGTHDEHVRQRFYRLYKAHPRSAMYIYLWSRCVDDPSKQLELSEEGIKADPSFSWSYNMAARALARQGKIPEALDYATKGAALDPGSFELAEKQKSLKQIIERKLLEQTVDKSATRYQGLFRRMIRSPEGADIQALEKGRLADYKGPVADAVHGFVVCANPFADVCVRAYVPRDGRLKPAWSPPAVDVGGIPEHRLVTLTGSIVVNARGENIMVVDAVAVEPP